MPTNLNRAKFAEELTYNTAGGTGAYQNLSGTLLQDAQILIFDNASNTTVTLSDDGVTNGKTFVAGEALVLDLQAARGSRAEELAWPIGTQFAAKSAAGVGSFRISIVYAR